MKEQRYEEIIKICRTQDALDSRGPWTESLCFFIRPQNNVKLCAA
jgi:hypothetical protein